MTTQQPIDDNIYQDSETGTETAALRAAGIPADAITETPDGITVTADDGSRFGVVYDGQDDDGQPWWNGTRYGADNEIEETDSWTTLEATALAVARWWGIATAFDLDEHSQGIWDLLHRDLALKERLVDALQALSVDDRISYEIRDKIETAISSQLRERGNLGPWSLGIIVEVLDHYQVPA